MLESIFQSRIWTGPLLAVILYILEYALSARDLFLYNRGGKDLIKIEGYQLIVANYLKPDGSIRWLHPRLIGILAVIIIGLPAAWWSLTGKQDLPQVYLLLLGGICLHACLNILDELRMISLWRDGVKGGLEGELKVSRRLMISTSYISLYGFAALFLLLFLFTGSWFILGGLAACFVMAMGQSHVALIK